MMSDAKIMTLNDLNGSEQFTKDYAPYRAVGRSENKGGKWLCRSTSTPPLCLHKSTDLQNSVGSRLGKERFEAF